MSSTISIRFQLGALAAFQLCAGFLLQVLILAVVRVGSETDAYIAALTVPLLVFSIFGTSIQNAWQPKLALAAVDRSAWLATQSAASGQVLLVAGGAALILAVSSPWWVDLAFPGFDQRQSRLAAQMTRVLMAGSIFSCLAAVCTAALRGTNRFVTGEVVPLGGILLSFPAVMMLVPVFGIEAVIWINLVRLFTVWLVLFCLAGRPLPSMRKAIRDREMWRMTTPLFAGASLYKTGPLIDRFWSSQSAAGSLTAFSLVQTGLGALGNVLDRALCLTALPRLAHFAKAENLRAMQRLCHQAMINTAIASGIFAGILLVIRPYVGQLVEFALGMHSAMADQLWLLTMLMLGYLWVTGCGYLVVAAFYALGDVRTPMRMSVFSFLLGAVLKAVAFLRWGLPGLAVATSAYYLINLIAMTYLLEKRVRASVP